LCFLKRNPMLFTVNRFFVLIPFKCNHKYIVWNKVEKSIVIAINCLILREG
jgi:hypothetical protein